MKSGVGTGSLVTQWDSTIKVDMSVPSGVHPECLQAEKKNAVDNYRTTESDKTKGTTRLLLSSGENKSLDVITMGSINRS